MKLLCALGGHEAGDEITYNSGYYFACCRRCGNDMVRSGASWQHVPGGHRVVWKTGRHAHSLDPDYGPVLPIVHPASPPPPARRKALPSRRRRRALVPVESQSMRRTNAAAVQPAEAPDYPFLLALAAIVGAGLQLVLGFRDFRGGF